MFVVALFMFVFLAGQTMVYILDEAGTSAGDVQTEVGTFVGDVQTEVGTSVGAYVQTEVLVPTGRECSVSPASLDENPVLCIQFCVREHRIPTLRVVSFLVLGILTQA